MTKATTENIAEAFLMKDREILRLRAENARLLAALKPFAVKAMAVEAQYENCLPADNLSAGIKYRDLRAARAAVEPERIVPMGEAE